MSKSVDYFFSPVSPWTYLGGKRVEGMARKYGVELRYKPCDYGKIFAASGGLPLGQRPKQRQAYRLVELERWRDFLGIRLNLQPKHFPVASDFAARAIVAAKQSGADPGILANALLRAVWAEERDISDRSARRLTSTGTNSIGARTGSIFSSAPSRRISGSERHAHPDVAHAVLARRAVQAHPLAGGEQDEDGQGAEEMAHRTIVADVAPGCANRSHPVTTTRHRLRASSRYSASGVTPMSEATWRRRPRGGNKPPLRVSQASSRSATVLSDSVSA